MYKVLFTKRSIKDLENLDLETRKRIIEKLKEYSTAPFDYAIKLSDKRLGDYRFRIGEFRVIFDIDDNNLVVLRIGHRKEIYK